MNRSLFLYWLVSAAALAQEEQFQLKAGPGREVVAANCVMCHSLDYIPMNSPFLDRAGWEKILTKMTRVMGAPVKEQDIPVILDYLTQMYGK